MIKLKKVENEKKKEYSNNQIKLISIIRIVRRRKKFVRIKEKEKMPRKSVNLIYFIFSFLLKLSFYLLFPIDFKSFLFYIKFDVYWNRNI